MDIWKHLLPPFSFRQERVTTSCFHVGIVTAFQTPRPVGSRTVRGWLYCWPFYFYFLSQKRRSFLPSFYSIADSSLFHKTGRGGDGPEPETRMETSGPASVFNTSEPSDAACPHTFCCLYILQCSSMYWSAHIHGPLAYIGVEGGTAPKQA